MILSFSHTSPDGKVNDGKTNMIQRHYAFMHENDEKNRETSTTAKSRKINPINVSVFFMLGNWIFRHGTACIDDLCSQYPSEPTFSNSKVVYGSQGRRRGFNKEPLLCLANFGRLKRSAKTCNWWTNGFHMILPSLFRSFIIHVTSSAIGVVKSMDECLHDTTPFLFPITCVRVAVVCNLWFTV